MSDTPPGCYRNHRTLLLFSTDRRTAYTDAAASLPQMPLNRLPDGLPGAGLRVERHDALQVPQPG